MPGLIHHAMMAPKLLEKGGALVVESAEAAGAALRGDVRA